MTSRDIMDLHPDLQPLCREFLARTHAENIHTFLTCTYRSNKEQDIEYAKGRTALGNIVTNAKAGQSKHNFTIDGEPASKAFDVAIRLDDGSLDWNTVHSCWHRIGEIGKELGLVWGGNWKQRDMPHFELTT